MARVVFVQNLLYEYHGLKVLSACLRGAGHEAKVVIASSPTGIARRVARLSPDAVGFYCATGDGGLVAAAAARIRRGGFSGLVVAGGPQPTLDPGGVLVPELDFVCVGEGERAIVELLERTEGGRRPALGRGLSNWAYLDGGRLVRPALRPLVEDLDALPPPDESLYAGYPALFRSSVRSFMGSRGCPHSCAFCCNRAFVELYAGLGRYWRAHSPEAFVAHISRARAARPFRIAALMDDDLLADRRWAVEFLSLYASRVAAPFVALVRVTHLSDELARLLVAAGCRQVIFGVESGDEEYRRRVLGKTISDAEILEGVAVMRRAGLAFATVNMVALPGETPAMTWRTVRFNQRLRPAESISHLYQPIPGTALCDEAVAGGFVAEEALRGIPSSSMHRSVLCQPGVAFATNAHHLFYLLVKHPRLAAAARPLLGLPPNPLFRFVHRASYFDFHRRFYGKSMLETARFGLSCLTGLHLDPRGEGRGAR